MKVTAHTDADLIGTLLRPTTSACSLPHSRALSQRRTKSPSRRFAAPFIRCIVGLSTQQLD